MLEGQRPVHFQLAVFQRTSWSGDNVRIQIALWKQLHLLQRFLPPTKQSQSSQSSTAYQAESLISSVYTAPFQVSPLRIEASVSTGFVQLLTRGEAVDSTCVWIFKWIKLHSNHWVYPREKRAWGFCPILLKSCICRWRGMLFVLPQCPYESCRIKVLAGGRSPPLKHCV